MDANGFFGEKLQSDHLTHTCLCNRGFHVCHDASRNVYVSAILEYRYPILYYGIKALQSFFSCISSVINSIVFDYK